MPLLKSVIALILQLSSRLLTRLPSPASRRRGVRIRLDARSGGFLRASSSGGRSLGRTRRRGSRGSRSLVRRVNLAPKGSKALKVLQAPWVPWVLVGLRVAMVILENLGRKDS